MEESETEKDDFSAKYKDMDYFWSQLEKLHSILKEMNQLVEESRLAIERMTQRIQDLKKLESKLLEKEVKIEMLESDLQNKKKKFEITLRSINNELERRMTEKLERSRMKTDKWKEKKKHLEDKIKKVTIILTYN